MPTQTSDATPLKREFFEAPFAWLCLTMALSLIPLIGYIWQARMPWNAIHPAVNAILNASAFVFLLVGKKAILTKRPNFHKQCMLAAFGTSSLFLLSYLTRYAISGTHHYPGHGWLKAVYLLILFSHMILATVLVPLVLRSLYLGFKDQKAKHKRISRWTWLVWSYVSVTGVVIYFMLYQFA